MWKNYQGDAIKRKLHEAARSALETGAEVLLEDANRTVPIEESTLQKSGSVSVDSSDLRAAVNYDTPYAVRQHEDTRLRHDAGRRAKWLQLTFEERVNTVRDLIADELKKVLR